MALVATPAGGLLLLCSPRLLDLGVPHAFTTRPGGVSAGVYAGLNLGSVTGDDRAAVGRNRALVCSALGFDLAALRMAAQVHGHDVTDVASASPGDCDEATAVAADGLYGADPGQLAGVRVADCQPVLLASDDGRWVAAVHAGWRGQADGILTVAVRGLCQRAQVAPERLVAAIGPCISAAHYEVSTEVLSRFDADLAQPTRPGHARLDLRAAAVRELYGLGVVRVDVSQHCTCAEPELFYSHRRDGAATGRQMGLIAPRR
ncbi:MAG: peptidoglycan editing factor PgeF [Armatimonadetes bacterium]|nr:peptidoglycan editing factor PgeF [Armatimonadota bacterium]